MEGYWAWWLAFSYTSTQGMTKKTPGPLVPPVSSRPRRKMTALSYSWRKLWRIAFNLIGVILAPISLHWDFSLPWSLTDLNDLHNEEEGEGERGDDQEDGDGREENWAYPRTLFTPRLVSLRAWHYHWAGSRLWGSFKLAESIPRWTCWDGLR